MDSDGFLHKYFLNNYNKRLHKWLHYFDVYERHFHRFRGKKPVMIEMGIAGGGSLEMWKQYFGEGSKIIGIDINENCRSFITNDIDVFIGSQDDANLIREILDKYPVVDIVLDDAGHFSPNMIGAFDLLYPKMSENGVYFIEDTHANYWKDWGGGLRKPDTFIEYCKNKIDDLNAVHTRGELLPTEFTASTNSINFYDSIVVFERRPQGARQAVVTIGMPLGASEGL